MQIGKYLIVSPLGSGNFGQVFHVIDQLLDAERALKVIILDTKTCSAEEFIAAFNEAKILEKCRHAHIVEIKEVDIYDVNGEHLPCITTEYLKNGSLQNLIETQFVSVQKNCKIAMDVLFGLEHAHGQNIYHRDIKPGNILLSNNWKAKLSDFGLAYGLSGQSFNFAGYNAHLSPEVLDRVIQDDLSDIYSLGVTFYRMLNNLKNLNVHFKNMDEFIKAVKKEKFPKRLYEPYIPDNIIKIANKAMKADRDKRYKFCLDFRQAIQKMKFYIDWKPLTPNTWEGMHNNDKYNIDLLKTARSGYQIDFKKNGRRILENCFSNIPNEKIALNEFYKTIRKTTIY